ncbi:MAG: energy transducer TonB [Candidatus Krumholzibacteriota bacterium]
MRLPVLILFFLFTAAGCSQMNVEVDSDRQDPHEKIFPDDLKGRSADYERPQVIEMPPVEYPAEAADLEASGMVMIRLLIDRDGKVAEAEVLQGVHPLVDQAALETARGGRYAPANEFGAAAEGWITVPFRYPPPEAAEK